MKQKFVTNKSRDKMVSDTPKTMQITAARWMRVAPSIGKHFLQVANWGKEDPSQTPRERLLHFLHSKILRKPVVIIVAEVCVLSLICMYFLLVWWNMS